MAITVAYVVFVAVLVTVVPLYLGWVPLVVMVGGALVATLGAAIVAPADGRGRHRR